jgi:hypothetical protein
MSKKAELVVSVFIDAIQQGFKYPVTIDARSKDSITSIRVWAQVFKQSSPSDPWGRKEPYKDGTSGFATADFSINKDAFPIVIDILEGAANNEPADLHRSEDVQVAPQGSTRAVTMHRKDGKVDDLKDKTPKELPATK